MYSLRDQFDNREYTMELTLGRTRHGGPERREVEKNGARGSN